MKKLLCVASHFSTGGMPQVLTKRVELIKDDLDIYVVEWENLSNDFVIQKNRIKKLLKPEHFITLGEDKTQILKIIKELDIDYIHFEEIPEFFVPFNISKEIYKSDRKYKIFETTHSSDYNVDEKIFFPDKFLFVSQYNCFKFNKFGIPTEVIEYPVEKTQRDSQKKIEAMKRLGLDPKFKHVVNVGLFTPRKNQAYAFEIARKLQNENVKFHFIGNQADNFQDYWRPLLRIKPKNCILWNERDDVDDFLEACDLFLFTSRGFRWNKELNPLVIKEALEHQIPQFLFPLDVYNRKYDIENTIHYLDGNIDVDAGLVKNFLFERKNLPWVSTYLNPYPDINKYKIRAVHLLLEEDDRKSESIKQLEKLKDWGIDYVQHINKKYTDTPPKEMCARPQDVGRIGAYALRGPHYGNYQSFKKAILTEFTDDIDFLMVFESDCKLTVPIDEFVEKVFASCDPMLERGIYYMSFGDNRNLRTGEIVSDDHGQINEWMYVTNKIIGIQSIMFPKNAFPFIKRAYETIPWDVSDLFFNDMFKNKGKAIAPRLTTQIEGISTIQGEAIEHFLLKNVDTLIKDKNPDDIIVEYNKEDQKFHFCLSDFFQNDIDNLFIIVNADNNKNIYKTESTKLSPFQPIWIQIYGHQKYGEFSFDFSHKDIFLFTKKVKLDIIPDSEIVREHIQEIIEEKKSIVNNVPNVPKEEKFSLDFHIEDNKLYIPYVGDIKDVRFDIIVKNIETKDNLFRVDDLIFNNGGYCNWVSTGANLYKTDPNFCGFEVDFIKNDKIVFSKSLRLRDKIITIEANEIIQFPVKPIINDDKAFIVLTYPDTKIKEDITERCINALKGNKIILASHYPVNKILQDKVDYYLYDAYNPLISHTLYNFYWSILPQGKAEIRLDKLQKKSNLNQSLTVFNNIENSVKFAKSVGIKKVICMSYDFIFNEDNLKTINDICNRMDNQNKKGYFMQYQEGDMKLYKSVFFIIDTDFYSTIFDKSVRTPEDFNTDCQINNSHNFLENYFYSKISSHANELIIEVTDEDKLFNNKEINIFSGVEYLAILPVKDDLNSFVIWFNSSNDKDNRRIDFYYNNNGEIEKGLHFIKQKSYYLKKITLSEEDNYEITANFIDQSTNNIIDKQVFKINRNNYNTILENGTFNENNSFVEEKKPVHTINNLNVTFNEDDNRIILSNTGEDFIGKFTVLDMDSKVPLHWCNIKVTKDTNYWIQPIPKSVIDFTNLKDFNGFEIQVYDSNDVFLFDKIIIIKKDPKPLNLSYMKWVTPFDCLYFIWRDFFIDKIYDDFLSKINLDVTMDLGANQGLFTHLLLTNGAKKVYAVEALKTGCDNMNKSFDERVIIINKAVSDVNGKKYLYFDNIDSTISNTDLERNSKHAPNVNISYDKVEVEAITMNDLMIGIDKIDLLKVDIEGDEYLVFKNITDENLLKIDNLLIEYHHNYDSEVDIIINRLKKDYNYQLIHTKQANGGNILANKIK